MKQVLLLGATGHLGSVLLRMLLENNYSVNTIVRNTKKLQFTDKNLNVITGDVTLEEDLIRGLHNSNCVISTLGHGFRTKYPIQENTVKTVIPLMEKRNIKRFITITGAGLHIAGDPPSLIATLAEHILPIIDPYRLQDAINQQQLLEKSNLNWTVIRTPIHSSNHNQIIKHIGNTQPLPWKTLSREAIASFVLQCIEKNIWIRKSPIIY